MENLGTCTIIKKGKKLTAQIVEQKGTKVHLSFDGKIALPSDWYENHEISRIWKTVSVDHGRSVGPKRTPNIKP